MPRKTQAERDRTNIQIRLKRTKDRQTKVEIVNEWVAVHSTVPDWLLHAFGHTEYVRGYSAAVREASE